MIKFFKEIFKKKSRTGGGFIEELPKPEDYQHQILGAKVEKVVLAKDGNWEKFMPKGELQKRSANGETMACVSFSAMNCLEAIINRHLLFIEKGKATEEEKEIVRIFDEAGLITNGQADFSDRYIAKLSGTTRNGNSQNKVAETIRKYGLVSESDWTYADGWSNYYKDVPQEVIDKGKKLLEKIEIKHEWVNPMNFEGSLKYAPLQISVFAWNGKIGDTYIRTDRQRNHASVLKNELPDYNGDYDTYKPFHKKLAKDFSMGWGKLFSIHLKKKQINKTELLRLKKRGFLYIQRTEKDKGALGEVYKLLDDRVRKLTKQETTELGVSTLAKIKDLTGYSEKDFKLLMNQ